MPDLAEQFLAESRTFLTQQYMPSIERAVAQLGDEQIWARANEASNSIGNLMLHLAGSSRYWAVEVIGGAPIGRVRQEEFDRRGLVRAGDLLVELRAAVSDVDRVLAALPGRSLLERRAARDEEPTVLWCVYHIVEHFSMHTGQILSMAKSLAGEAWIPER